MKLEDVIHFYLGCDVLDFPNGGTIGKLVGVDRSEVILKYYNSKWDKFSVNTSWRLNINEIKPILIRPEDMTEEVANNFLFNHVKSGVYAWINVSSVSASCIRYEFTYKTSNRKREGSISFHELTPAQFYDLIKLGLDLFGLIDSGQALDKKNFK